jgi:hypothetical protein
VILSSPRQRRKLGWVWSFAALLVACSSAPTRPPENARTAAGVPRGGHDLTCEYAGMESVQGWNDTDSDTAGLFAVFHLPEARTLPPKERVSWKAQVSRSRTMEYQDELATRTESICNPEAGTPHPFQTSAP